MLGHQPLDRAPGAKAERAGLHRRLHDAQRLGGLLPLAPLARGGSGGGHLLQRLTIRVGIRILEGPSLQEIAHLVAQRLVGLRTRFRRALLCVLRELR